MGLIKSLFGDYSKREIKRIQPLCDKVLGLEETYQMCIRDSCTSCFPGCGPVRRKRISASACGSCIRKAWPGGDKGPPEIGRP